jgi:hypothetical protein
MKAQPFILLSALLLLALPLTCFSQTSDYSFRSSINLEMKIAKGLKLELAPEYRLNSSGDANTMLVQAGLNYKVAKWLSVGGYYRLSGSKIQDTETVGGSSFDYSNRFAIDANTKISFKRFTTKLRVRFCNFSDFDSQTDDKTNYLRYRLGLDYNIKGVKLTPYASAEFYQKLSTGLFSKSRYSIGAEYELNKHNAISAGYTFADKFKTNTNYHIFELTYKITF